MTKRAYTASHRGCTQRTWDGIFPSEGAARSEAVASRGHSVSPSGAPPFQTVLFWK